MTQADIEHFNDSLTRCISNPDFLKRFYELFMASSPEVRDRFRQTDFQKQHRVLKASLFMMMLAADGHQEGLDHVARLGARHSKRDLDIPPHLYDLWLQCLIQAVRECDRLFTPETERVWRQMMEKGIASMKAAYETNIGME